MTFPAIIFHAEFVGKTGNAFLIKLPSWGHSHPAKRLSIRSDMPSLSDGAFSTFPVKTRK